MTVPGESENPSAGHGMVVLDIGDNVGALVVICPPELAGQELEISPAGLRASDPAGHHHEWFGPIPGTPHEHPPAPAWPHVGVLPRQVRTGQVCAAVFPALTTGRYDVWIRPHGVDGVTAEVEGGTVTTVEWPAS